MSSNKNFGNVCAFIAIFILALTMVISKVFGWLNIQAGTVLNIINLVGWFATLFALVISGYEFCSRKGKKFIIVFWVVVVIIVIFRFI